MFKHSGEYYTSELASANGASRKIYVEEDTAEYLWYDEISGYTFTDYWRISDQFGTNLKESDGKIFRNQNKALLFSNRTYFNNGTEYIWIIDDVENKWYLSGGLATKTDYYFDNGVEKGNEFWRASSSPFTFSPLGVNSGSRPTRTFTFEPFSGWVKTSKFGEPPGTYRKHTDNVAEDLYRFVGMTNWIIDGFRYVEQADKDSGGNRVFIAEAKVDEIRYDDAKGGWVLNDTESSGYWMTTTDPTQGFDTSSGIMPAVTLNPFEGATGTKTMTFEKYSTGYATAYRFDIASYK